jgi:hypothetical protein
MDESPLKIIMGENPYSFFIFDFNKNGFGVELRV